MSPCILIAGADIRREKDIRYYTGECLWIGNKTHMEDSYIKMLMITFKLMEENNVETSSKFVTKGLKSVEYLQHTR
jgi:hypothetical protein